MPTILFVRELVGSIKHFLRTGNWSLFGHQQHKIGFMQPNVLQLFNFKTNPNKHPNLPPVVCFLLCERRQFWKSHGLLEPALGDAARVAVAAQHQAPSGCFRSTVAWSCNKIPRSKRSVDLVPNQKTTSIRRSLRPATCPLRIGGNAPTSA